MLTPEEIQKLAEEKYPYKRGMGNSNIYTNLRREDFIEGYTTCQNTEVAELKKELERVKGLLETTKKQNLLYREPLYSKSQIESLWKAFVIYHNL